MIAHPIFLTDLLNTLFARLDFITQYFGGGKLLPWQAFFKMAKPSLLYPRLCTCVITNTVNEGKSKAFD